MRRWPRLLAILIALVVSRPALALDPGRAVSQYLVEVWGAERGYLGGAVHGITQSADGHLWIASEKGLVRFDGLTFTLFVPPSGPAGTGPAVLGAAADGQGGVWGRLRGPMLVRHHDRVLRRLEWPGHEDTVVTAMLRGRDGRMLLTPLGRGVLQDGPGRVSTRVAPALMPNSFVIALCETSDGALWLGTRDAGLLQVQGTQVRPVMNGLPDRKINALQAGPDGTLWIATDRGVARWTGREIVLASLPRPLQHASANAMARDRDGQLWISFGALGVVRVSASGEAAMVPRDARTRGDVTTMFEDRDGTLWFGTSRGIERWRDGAFTTFAGAQGLPDDGVGPIFADAAGRVWMGPPTGGLYWLERGAVHRVHDAGLDADVVYSLSGSGDDLWVGRRRGGLTRIRLDGVRPSIERLTEADGLAQDSVFAVERARDGSVWAGTLSAGLSRYQAGRFTTYDVADGLASNTVTAILEAVDGSLWFGTPSGVSIRSGDRWRTLDATGGLPANEVTALLQDRSGIIWVGTSAGLAYVEHGRVRRVAPTPLLAGAIAGLGEDGRGRLWVTTAERVVSADPAQLRSAPATAAVVREFGPLDGLVRAEGVKRHRSVVTDRHGSIWLSLVGGLSRLDVSRRELQRGPITATVDAIVGDDQVLTVGEVVQVPARTRRITIALAGASLATPERVRFRYRLDGFDTEWTAATDRRAAYTNLPPGHYEFRLMASDVAGAWPGREARLRLRVAPAFWQTAWFRGAVVLAFVGTGWGAYRLRLRQVARRLARTFEARLAERTRIAQDLHDTLLQGCLSASMQLHVAVDRLPDDAPTRPALERIQQLMSRVIDEGRAAVHGLRMGEPGAEALDQALARAPRELAPDHPAGFRVVVDGQPRDLHPIIRDEVYRIGREAIANALRHADARHIEVELAYTPAQLRLSVRDDGRGIDEGVLRDGREGHWGLEGMRERALAIGAAFRLSSRADAGTEVDLVVPAGIAFASEETSRS